MEDEYLRLVDRRTGAERVVHGPTTVAPAAEVPVVYHFLCIVPLLEWCAA